jgi:hypothetical protein
LWLWLDLRGLALLAIFITGVTGFALSSAAIGQVGPGSGAFVALLTRRGNSFGEIH